jgi:ubiquinone/menaquinone biosynthesis C-methylase UbiE
MRTSTSDEVRKMYDDTADSYAKMMDTEMEHPVYADILERLRDRIANTPGAVVDTACGSGHLLCMFHERYDQKHPLLGVDLSPRMVSIAAKKLGPNARVVVGDMRDLSTLGFGAGSAVLNFFALHHLEHAGVESAFREWYRFLAPGGQLVVGAWEGSGVIDYGDESDIVALRYGSNELVTWAEGAGFSVTRCVVEPEEEYPMDAMYLEGIKLA